MAGLIESLRNLARLGKEAPDLISKVHTLNQAIGDTATRAELEALRDHLAGRLEQLDQHIYGDATKTQDLIKKLTKKQKSSDLRKAIYGTLGVGGLLAAQTGAALGLAGAVTGGGLAYKYLQKKHGYRALVKKYPSLKTKKAKDLYDALYHMAPEVATHPTLAGPTLRRIMDYGDETAHPSIMLDIHSKLRRQPARPSEWFVASGKMLSPAARLIPT